MPKGKLLYHCGDCGAQFTKWSGQCSECEAWNTLTESWLEPRPAKARQLHSNSPGFSGATVCSLNEVALQEGLRIGSGIRELDRVLGNGIVAGSVVLIGGDPGIGKSTLLLQALATLSERLPTLYVNGEESLAQVGLRANRLGLSPEKLLLLAETHLESIMEVAEQKRPQVMVIDSIQTLFTESLHSPPGAVSQVRENAAQLIHFAKRTNVAVFLVGHVTKEGTLAGPRILEHMVDTVLYFEGDTRSPFRVVRAVKNRFGAINELGVFGMTDKGLREVSSPSAIFLSRYDQPVPGSVVTVTREGSRPLLVEAQALVDESHTENPRRVTLGMDQNRLAMLLAVLNRHGRVATHGQDVYVNIVGGIRVSETGADLAVLLAALSSLRDSPVPNDWVVFGEVGLAGEIRPVQGGQERLRDAWKHGFKHALIPKANAPKDSFDDMKITTVQRLQEALEALH